MTHNTLYPKSRIYFRLEWFGEVGMLVSEMGHLEQTDTSPTSSSDPSFIVR